MYVLLSIKEKEEKRLEAKVRAEQAALIARAKERENFERKQ